MGHRANDNSHGKNENGHKVLKFASEIIFSSISWQYTKCKSPVKIYKNVIIDMIIYNHTLNLIDKNKMFLIYT